MNSTNDGYRRNYFPTKDVFLQDRHIMALLRQRVPRSIVLILLQRETIDYDGLVAALGLSKPTLSFHLRKLLSGKILTVERSEGRNRYGLVDREHTLRLLLAYRDGLLDGAVDGFTEVWLSYLESGRGSK